MILKNKFAAFAAVILAASLTSCGSSSSSSEAGTQAPAETTAANAETTEAPTETEEETAEATTEELIPPSPVEASDPNAVTFDDGNFDFAQVKDVDLDCAHGTLSIAEIQGNKMLKFNDDFTVPLDGKVQKIIINAAELIGAENVAKVKSIEFDVYADAVAENYTNQDGEKVKAPGTICGGGGTVTAKKNDKGEGQWYDFSGFEGGEYNFDMSGPVHGEFKFLLSAGGLSWSDEMDDANFLVMRWGSENDSNFYLDNIVFFDEDGNSIPLKKGGEAASEETEETSDEASEETSEETTEESSEEAPAEEETAAE